MRLGLDRLLQISFFIICVHFLPPPTRHVSSHPFTASRRKHLLNSPLLSRRRQRRGTVESSDDEVLHCSSDAEVLCSSSNYRDLETFQKTQLRNKVVVVVVVVVVTDAVV
ncbi:hypothetical protein E2C01_091719 [Portunus trituberculatus]|uniref:Uncharacterized protein n=1 Tax=Portunus trituberculatus TaxID=210409 RepID=A0A5B7JIA0_PORTR|nr:hypothetical protein [Portunus trituberculatus]